jgi:uncharacterized protein
METVLITGASSGIGLELARCFAADKSRLVLTARSEDKLEALAAELRKTYGADVQVIVNDLAEAAGPQQLVAALKLRRIDVDVLVNNAGFGARGRFADLDVRRQADMVQVNVAAPTILTRLLLPGMIERRRGAILNVASTAGFQPGPFLAVYYATKAYVLSWSEALTEELRGKGITVTCLCPGPTATNFADVADMAATPIFRLGMMDAASVARAGYRALRRRRAVIITGVINRFGAFCVRLFPRAIIRKVTRWANH